MTQRLQHISHPSHGGPEEHLTTASRDALFDVLPLPAFALDAEACVTAWNAAAERAFGWPAAEVLGTATPFARAGAREALRRVAAGEAVDGTLDLAFVALDGSPRRARLRSGPLGPAGREGIVLVDAGGVDRAELNAVEPSESCVLQTVLDAIPTPIWFKTVDGIYRGCNLAFEQALGKTRADIVGHSVDSAGPQDLANIYRSADRSLFASGGTQVYEGELSRADGERRRVTFHKAAFRDRSGSVVGLAGALLDVTDLRRTEEDLRRALEVARSAESRFARLVESTPDLVLIHRGGQIFYANAAVARLAGRSAAQLTGTSVLDCVHPDDRERLAARLVATGRLPPVEGRWLGCDGRVTHVEFISVGLEMDDGPVRVAIGRDLTERKRAEERLQRSDRLAALGTLAAGVAHELNNPLSFVLSNAEWAVERLARAATPALRDLDEIVRALRDVVQGARRMKVIVSDLRTAARDECASDILGPVDLRRVVDFAAQLTNGELRRRARLELEVERVSPVFGSETRLGQVLVNLLVNASQAMTDDDPRRNVIRVALSEGAGRRVVLTVSDNGRGIPPSVRPHLFEPFYTTKPVGEGTGLGLWVCHGIVAAHGGEIEVESELGQGSAFRVVLPVHADGRAAAPAAAVVGPAP